MAHDSPALPEPGKDSDEGGYTIMQMDERELPDIDIDKLEEAFNKKELQTIWVEQLKKVHKVLINSTTGATSRLGIRLDLDPNPKWIPKEGKQHGRKMSHQLIK
jgi:hypothetical protein